MLSYIDISLSIYLSIYLFIYLFIYLLIYLFIYLFITILPDETLSLISLIFSKALIALLLLYFGKSDSTVSLNEYNNSVAEYIADSVSVI